jgi:adenosine kinase
VYYREDESTPTGTCAVLIHEKERSLVANLAAANKYVPEHLQSADIWSVVEGASLYYSAGFFLTVSPPSLMIIAKHAAEKNKILAVNLAAPFIPQYFDKPLADVMAYADFVFGNETEAEAWAQKAGLPSPTVEAAAIAIAALPKVNTKRQRVVVFTQGSKSTLVATSGAGVTTFAVTPLDKALIVDTNGAGDAFVGGFLSQLAQGQSIAKCVEGGHYAARKIIQVSGTKLVGVPDATFA